MSGMYDSEGFPIGERVKSKGQLVARLDAETWDQLGALKTTYEANLGRKLTITDVIRVAIRKTYKAATAAPEPPAPAPEPPAPELAAYPDIRPKRMSRKKGSKQCQSDSVSES